jgi:hypothetical protein
MPSAYSLKLKFSPEWKALKNRLLSSRGRICEDCGAQPRYDSQIHIHHKYYDSTREPHDYPDDVFKILCQDCHELTTEALKSMLFCLGRFTGHQIVTLEIALTIAIVESGDPRIIHNWLLACLDNPKQAQLSFAGVEQ